ncbi:MAG: hypothetical protein ACRED9_13215 [Caulobacteraceae bacterium]
MTDLRPKVRLPDGRLEEGGGAQGPGPHPPACEPIQADQQLAATSIRYSICTLVTRKAQYEEMAASFRSKGFTGPDCEFLYLDNSQTNRFDAYAGCNLFLGVARGEYIIICHQDVLLVDDGRDRLDEIIAEMERRAPDWGVLGSGGAISLWRLAVRISDPHGENQNLGGLPARVQSLDEAFILVRRRANLAVSADLSGFHFYGADICILANLLGWTCWVVDFHLRHASAGRRDRSFESLRIALVKKYRRRWRARWITTPSATLYLSANPILSRLFNGGTATRITGHLSSKARARQRARGE